MVFIVYFSISNFLKIISVLLLYTYELFSLAGFMWYTFVTIVVIGLFVLDFKAVSWSNTPFQCAGGVEIGFSQLGGVNHLKYKEVNMTLTVAHWSLYKMANISKYMVLKEKAVHFYSNFTECCFWKSNWQKKIILIRVMLWLFSGLALNKSKPLF